MVYLNYNDLSEKAQNRLLSASKKDVENRFGQDIKTYAREHRLDYGSLLEAEAQRNLYNYNYTFNI